MTAFCLAHEQAVRAAAFRYLEELTVTEGESLPWQALAHGFSYEGEPVPLDSQNGIFKPKILDCPISIRTTPPKLGKEAPYADRIGANGTLRYSFRDPSKPAGGEDILDEIDGPMLEHGIKGRHGQTLVLPRSAARHPRKTWLEERFVQFKAAR